MTEFFIKRPVFSIVVSLLILIVGALSYRQLSVDEYPKVSLPRITVVAPYPNASAEVVESDIIPLLEEQLASVAGLEKMTSSATDGSAFVSLRFVPSISMDRALAQVHDQVALARSRWPKDAKEPIIQQEGSSSQPFIWLSLLGTGHEFAELTHFARLYVKNQLQTIQGVSSVVLFGPPYTMSIAMDRLKMYGYGVSASDVVLALEANKASFPAGRFRKEIPVTLRFALEEPEDFEKVVVKKNKNGVVLLRDVATVSLGYDDENIARINGKSAVFLGLIKSSDGNPLSISEAVKQMVPVLSATLPPGIKLALEFDGATFIRASLNGIKSSILEASLFVLLIIFLFLRNFRSTLIPLLTIPISLIGTLAFVSAFGFSINTISLLALVLAVGLVVDDAIVVLENIHRHMEKGLSALEAAKKGSREIAFAIVAMTLTLASVYAPIAFIGGVIGQLFIEFALTLAGAVIVSGVVALTLSPMMCSRLLRSEHKELFPIIDKWIAALNHSYRRRLAGVLNHPKSVFVSALFIIGVGVFLYWGVPSELAPKEDRGFIGASLQPLPGKPVTALMPYVLKAEEIFQKREEAIRTFTFGGAGPQGLIVGTPLKDWALRKKHSVEIIDEVQAKLDQIPAIQAYGFNWDTGLPGIDLGERGSAIEISVRTTGSYAELSAMMDKLQNSLEKDGVITQLWHDMHMDVPGFRAKVNEKKMAMLGVAPQDLALTMESSFDKNTNIEFLKDGVRYNVSLTASRLPNDLSEVYVNNALGRPIPLSSVVTLIPTALPAALNHTNQLRSASLGARLAPGKTLSDAVAYVRKKMPGELPAGYTYEFAGAVQKQQESAGLMLLLFSMALVFIFCVLAMQFESFTDPFIILLTVPLASCGALLFMRLFGQSMNIFTQIGLITLIGLITKHGILIVDFANHKMLEGVSAIDAILEAASLRLRPVLMTTGAMVLGSLPLMTASGAGSEARRAIGTVLVGGLTFGTLLTLFVIPSVYLFVKSLRRRHSPATSL